MNTSKLVLGVSGLVTTLIGLGMVACSVVGTNSSNSPEILIDQQAQVWLCGEVISRGRSVPALQKAELLGTKHVEHTSMSGNIYLLLTDDCRKGTDFSIAPAESAAVIQQVNDSSGAAVLVVLKPLAKEFDVSFGASSGRPRTAQVRLSDDDPA